MKPEIFVTLEIPLPVRDKREDHNMESGLIMTLKLLIMFLSFLRCPNVNLMLPPAVLAGVETFYSC